MTPSLSIIIITLNEAERITGILRDLQRQSFQEFEVIIADSKSTDATALRVLEMAPYFRQCRFTNFQQTLGPSYGRNYGAAEAQYEQLLFLDADTRIPDQRFLERFMHLTSAPQAPEAGAMYLQPGSPSLRSWAVYGVMNLGFFLTQYASPTACGACMFSTQTVHRAIGGFREDVCLAEDCDYVRDAKRQGFRVGMLPLRYQFSERRLQQDGYLRTSWTYLQSHLVRFITGRSVEKASIPYAFGHYKS
ncbi:glycosyltransferase [Candidatus Peribacteria bacterium]|nr:glycosyltransferase [Candidatus Peribacteria bacterium]